MKKIFLLVLLIICLYRPNVLAQEQLDDGWHFVVKNADSEKEKNWNEQAKEWAYYENGIEVLRYSQLVGSHRGWGEAPENSLAAFQMTRDKGYYAFETDIRFTKDNVAVLAHDATINSVAKNNDLTDISNTVYIKDLTFAELKNNYIFNIERVNHSAPTVLSVYNTNRITSFEEMLDFVKENRMYVSIELKEGTQEQIESLVKMTQDKNMHNYVRWISFYTDLLKYVRDYDDDESLSITKSTSCDTVHNLYCGEEKEYFHDKLKTDNNNLWMAYSPVNYNLPSIACAVNLPTNYDSYLPTSFVGTPISKGKITITEENGTILIGNEKTLSYNYDGDGVVKCVSENPEELTCSLDNNNHEILLKSIGNKKSNVKVYLYATQGIETSASDDYLVQLSIIDNESSTLKNSSRILILILSIIILIGSYITINIINKKLNK